MPQGPVVSDRFRSQTPGEYLWAATILRAESLFVSRKHPRPRQSRSMRPTRTLGRQCLYQLTAALNSATALSKPNDAFAMAV
jgi:hypothetical protein